MKHNLTVSTIGSPEFINLQPLDLNPLMSSCEIKVLYLNENRNKSFISKAVATEMSKTLRGSPIVGYFKEADNDFGDHGKRLVIDDKGVNFECMTKPYGFVAPDAKVWFQTFQEMDDFGNSVERQYLMTTGYLWTGQFEECASAVKDGKGQSMELDDETLKGSWSVNAKTGMEFFIINDAVFSKLCILGDNVEPCFEGASVAAPSISKNFSLDDDFRTTLFSMMQDLKNVLGGTEMDNMVEETVVEETTVEETVEETTVEETSTQESADTSVTSEFKKEEEKQEDKKEGEEKEDDASEEKDEESDKEDDDKKKKYSLLESDYTALQSDFNALQAKYTELLSECESLREFKVTVEDGKKDELIAQFYMLSDEDKKDVIENKRNYSYDDIEAKLSVICVRKKVNFNLDTDEEDTKAENDTITLFNLNEDNSSVPAYISALRDTRKNRV